MATYLRARVGLGSSVGSEGWVVSFWNVSFWAADVGFEVD